jgi:hypothetical protein
MTLITDLFLRFRSFILSPKKESKRFLSQLFHVLAGPDREVCICAFRSFTAVFDSLWLEYKLAKRQELLFGLLEATGHPSVVHHLAIRFVINQKCPKFRYMTMCKNIAKQGMRDPRDACVIEHLLMIPKVKKPLVGLKFLATAAASDRVWSREAICALIQPLGRCHELEEVKIWLPIFVKKLFVFVGACIARKRYRHRQLMVGHLLKCLLTIEASWLVRSISACYGALLSKRYCPFSLPVDLAGVAIDRALLIETDLIANSQINLKEFFTTTHIARAILPPPHRPVQEPTRTPGRKFAAKAAKAPKVPIAVPKLHPRVALRPSPSADVLK